MAARVVVVGSYNQDMVWRTARFPVPGETRMGRFDTGPGGKGFNQAIACQRQGVQTHFIGALGDDALAHGMRELALGEGLALHCETHPELATGTAAILVEDSGQNLIVVGPGANAALSVPHIEAQAAVLRGARVLITQHEVNYEASLAAQRIIRASEPPSTAFRPKRARSARRSGASEPMPPIWIAIELKLAKPHRA
jgi:ribokinase